MPMEIEAKFRVERREDFIKKLEQLGAAFQKTAVQRDIFFDRPDHRLLRSDCGLRLRAEREADKCRDSMCFKGARQEGQFKRRQEWEFTVGDIDTARELLKALGFVSTIIVEKDRQIYQVRDCIVCLDRVSGLGNFIEIEGTSEQAIARVQSELGLAECEHIRDSYAVLLAQNNIDDKK